MDSDTTLASLSRSLRRVPADLAVMGVLTVLLNFAVVTPVVRESPLRILVGFVFLVFVPGYVFMAALFPEAGDGDSAAERATGSEPTHAQEFPWPVPDRSGLSGIERVTLSVISSVILISLIGFILAFTPLALGLGPSLLTASAVTLALLAVATVRRWKCPEADRFRVPYRDWVNASRSAFLTPASRTDFATTLLLAVTCLLAVGSVSYALGTPAQEEQFSEVYLLTEDEDGDLVADGYPSEFEVGESQGVVLGIENHEQHPTDYRIVVAEQRVEHQGNDTVVADQRKLNQFSPHLNQGETWLQSQELAPTMAGNETRLVWLVYTGDNIPDEPTVDNAAYTVQLQTNITESS